MSEKLNIYIVSDYRVGAADGLAEFNFQNTNLLKDDFNFHFIEFDKEKPVSFFKTQQIDGFQILKFGIKHLQFMRLPISFISWLKSHTIPNAIFHLHHIFNLRNYLISRQLVKYNLPYLITPHDSFVYAKEYRMQRPFIKRLYRDTFVHFFDKYVLDHAKLIHALTEQCPPCLRLITNSRITVVLNQVNDMHLHFDPGNVKQQVCFIGRFDIFRKGIDLSIEGYQQFKEKSNHSLETSFFLIGPADLSSQNEIRQICKNLELEIGKDVILTGKISVQERNRILSESKVYIQLSRTEGFGLSIAQALSCYKPVIVSKQVPIHDKILAHNAGFAVSNPKEAAAALETIFNLSAKEYSEMANNARRCYEEEFHPSIIKPQLIKLYHKVWDLAAN